MILGDYINYEKGFAFKSSHYTNKGIAIIRVSNFTENSIDMTDVYYISEQEKLNVKNIILKTDDVVIATVGSWATNPASIVGKVIRVPKEANNSLLNQNAVRLRCKYPEEQIFLYYALKDKKFSNYLLSTAQGSANQASITIKSILNYSLPHLTKNEKLKISKILNSLDQKIILNTQTNQTLEQIAQAIFKHWFIDFAPVHAKANALARGETIEQAELAAMACLSGKTAEKITALKAQDPTTYHQLQQTAAAFPSEFVETEMGQVPKGWEVLKFKDFVKETKEKVGKLQGIEEYSVGNEGIYPRKEKYKKQLAKDPSKNKLIREANIVFGMGNKEVNWGIMRDKIGSVSSAYNIFQINDINHLFLDMFINNIPYYFRDIIKPTSRQGQTIDKEAFLEKTIYYPNKEIINIFLEKITQINELSICIKSQNIYLLSIRDYLLPKLLGGEIKL